MLLRRPPERGRYWQGAAGGVEEDEDILEAAGRELVEETGLTPLTLERIGFTYSFPLEDKWRHLFAPGVKTITEPFFVAHVDALLEPKLSHEHDGYKWCQLDEALVLLTWPERPEYVEALKECHKVISAKKSMRLVRYRPEYQEPMIELHRSARDDLVRMGLTIGISESEEEADLRTIEQVYLQSGGEFLIGLLDGVVMAMGGFQRLSDDSAELRRMRIRKDLQDQGYGGRLLRELEKRAFKSGIRTLSFETAKARPLTLEFYHKHGYQETGSGFYGQVETVHFRKVLDKTVAGGEGGK